MVLIFTAIIGSYLLLSTKIEGSVDRIGATTVAVTEVRGDLRVMNERTVNMDKKLDAIAAKVGVK